MTELPTAECFRCGQNAYVGADGIRCFCTDSQSAQERHQAGRPCPRCGLTLHHTEVRTRTLRVHHIDTRAPACVLPNLEREDR